MAAVALGLVLGISALLCGSHLSAPFDASMQGWNGAWYSLVGHNYLRYGPAELGFAMCIEPGAVVEQPRIYLNHPPMIGLLVAASFEVLGEGEWQARLVPFCLALGAIACLFFFLRRVLAGSVALAAAGCLLVAGTPLFAYYASMPDPQGSGVIFALAGALWFSARWQEHRRRRDLVALLAFLLFGYLTDWPTFFGAALLGLWALLAGGTGARRACAWIWGSALVFGIALLCWTELVRSRFTNASSPLLGLGHRSGLAHGLADDQGHPFTLAESILRVGHHHLTGFVWLLSLAGLAATAWLILQARRRRLTPERALLLVFLGVGSLHVLAFPQGATVHDYWQIYLAPGLALPLCHLLERATDRGGRGRLAAFVLAAALVLLTCTRAWHESRRRWSEQTLHLTKFKDVGRRLARHSQADELIASATRRWMPLTYYADRKIIWQLDDPAALLRGWAPIAQRAGGFLVRVGDAARFETFLQAARMQGPIPLGPFLFWDAKP